MTFRHQDHVKIRQVAVTARSRSPAWRFYRNVLEDVVAAIVGVALLAYLFYALLRPERF